MCELAEVVFPVNEYWTKRDLYHCGNKWRR